MTTEDDFQRALDARPNDWQCRLVFADWLQEQGDPRAEGYRALGTRGHFPRMPHDAEDYCPWLGCEGCWVNWDGKENPLLPKDWFTLIKLDGKSDSFAPDHDYRTDATRCEVEDAAALAFASLPAARRAELLATPCTAG